MTYKHEYKYIQAGSSVSTASKALVLLHGRGSSARGIIPLMDQFELSAPYAMAPEATNQSWYPYSFMAPRERNQPALDTALSVVDQVVSDLQVKGFAKEQIYFVGFSQGACLALEYATNNAARYGGIVAFTGGLIGETIDPSLYKGEFQGTPIFISGGDMDHHVPLERMQQTKNLVEKLGARARLEIYPGKPHSISMEELILAKEFIFSGNSA